jgi:hypothetical protein
MDDTFTMAAGEVEDEGRPTKVLSTKLSAEDFMTCKLFLKNYLKTSC